MTLFKQPDLESYYNDERIKYEQYRAGYYAFVTVSVLFLSAGAVALFFWDDQISVGSAASVATVILMIGFWIVVIRSWRSGMTEAYREMVNSRPALRRRTLWGLVISTVLFGITMGFFDYYFISETPSVRRSIIFGFTVAVAQGVWQYWWQFRKVRKAEKEDASSVK